MKLTKFRVTNFRSIEDSTWIDCNNITNIIGVNEAGKSNALLALWKLHPARDGEINLLEDLPRNKYASLKGSCDDLKFIEAHFELDEELCNKFSKLSNHSPEEFSSVYIARKYNGNYIYQFKNEKKAPPLSSQDVNAPIEAFLNKVPSDSELECIPKIQDILEQLAQLIKDEEFLSYSHMPDLIQSIDDLSQYESVLTDSKLCVPFTELLTSLNYTYEQLNIPPISETDIHNLIIKELPTFVYYSNYGNLDSEIYLPNVISDLKRTDISGIAATKARTLKILFDFIKLSPQEILDLGYDSNTLQDQQQILEFAKKKEERQILLSSASSDLTKKFKNWWKQGNYKFDLKADGNFFKIWVSDSLREEQISLEHRSTGLQWFLSFYLTFLVETRDSLKGSILLLDEAGLSLHPLAQKDLIAFFKNLSKENQIIHTTHSPFLVDTENIDNVKLAYVDSNGYTVLSNNLRANSDPKIKTSIYAVHAALGLNVSDVLLHGCQPVIVEGPSDQYYLYAIKNFLIANSKIHPKKELVFMPAGGVKGVSSLASIISTNGELPYVVLDSDKSGNDFKSKLINGLYKDESSKVISLSDITNSENSEIEDIIPFNCLSKAVDKLFNTIDDFDFEDSIYNTNAPLINQIESTAKDNHILLPPGYKVELAKAAKDKILKLGKDHEYISIWTNLFKKIIK